jgi:hypothetical protein
MAMLDSCACMRLAGPRVCDQAVSVLVARYVHSDLFAGDAVAVTEHISHLKIQRVACMLRI